MTPQLRVATYAELSKVAQTCGFEWVRCRGSHNTFRNSEGRAIVIPNHGSRPLTRSLIRKILRDIGIGIEDYNRLLSRLE